MREIRNSNGHLVARIDEAMKVVEIKNKDCVTWIQFYQTGEIRIVNTLKPAA